MGDGERRTSARKTSRIGDVNSPSSIRCGVRIEEAVVNANKGFSMEEQKKKKETEEEIQREEGRKEKVR